MSALRLTVERLGHHGDGIAAGPEGPVYVPLALPGEVVEGEVAAGRMVAPRILTPSPDRVRAPCPHYRACGGCVLQHASDGFVAAWKRRVVELALEGQGLAAPVLGVATSPPASRRRAAMAGRRGKAGATVGLHARGSDLVVDTPGCLVVRPEIRAARPALEALARLGASRKGEVALAVTVAAPGLDVAVTGGRAADPGLRAALAGLAEAHRLARLSWNGEVVALRAPPEQRFGPARVVPPPGAFLQATAEGEAALLAAVRAAVGGAGRIVDLFAGSGTFALPLAEWAEVHAVEGEAAALAALDRGWRGAGGLRRVTTEARDLFRRPLDRAELARFDAAVIDPPRAGAEAQMRAIAESDLAVVAAVSCNPVTFARDARILLAAGFRLDGVEVVDQFRWSPHVELSARFTR